MKRAELRLTKREIRMEIIRLTFLLEGIDGFEISTIGDAGLRDLNTVIEDLKSLEKGTL